MMLSSDEITWINHAGYQLASGQVCLICDPWLGGAAFDRGWDLLVPSDFSAKALGEATHIWISHEHPDHFVPSDLRRVDPSRRAALTVLYQRTLDKRVVSFCQNLGFNVLELDPGIPYEFGPGVRGIIGTVGSDSWLYVRTPGFTYLNINDCVLDSPKHFSTLKKVVTDPLDVLFAQFSYANWAGNPGDLHCMCQEAASKIDQLKRSLLELSPRFLVPFASFVYFSHVENFYLNEGMNDVGKIFALFETADRPCIVMYPGDVWTAGAPHDSRARIARYASAAASIKPQHDVRPVSFAELEQLALDCARRLEEHNNIWCIYALGLARVIPPLAVHLNDLDITILYRPGRRLKIDKNTRPDIRCSAGAFAQCLRVDYGADTLLVNGRFQVLRSGGLAKLSRAFGINRLNNRGIGFPSPHLLQLRFGRLGRDAPRPTPERP